MKAAHGRPIRAGICRLLPVLAISLASTPLLPATGDAQTAITAPALLWRYIPGGLLTSPVAFGTDGGTYFSAEDRYFYHLDAKGNPVFRFDLVDRGGGVAAAGPDGVSYCSTADGTIHAVNRFGDAVWTFLPSGSPSVDTNAAVPAPLAVIPSPSGLAVAAYEGGDVVELSSQGRPLWSLHFEKHLATPPVFEDSLFYLADAGFRLYGVRPDGTVAWSVLLEDAHPGEHPSVLAGGHNKASAQGLTSPLEISPEVAPARTGGGTGGAERLVLAGSLGSVWFVGPGGNVAWRTSLPDGVTPVDAAVVGRQGDGSSSTGAGVTDAAAVVLGVDGKLYGFGEGGSLRFTAFLRDTKITAVRASADGTARIFAATDRGIILDMDARGAVSANAQTPEHTAIRALSSAPSGALIASGDNWVLYGYAVGDRSRTDGTGGGRGGANPPASAIVARADIPEVLPLQNSFREDANFAYLNGLVSSGDENNIAAALNMIQRRISAGQLRGSLAYTCYLLEQVAASVALSKDTRPLRGAVATPQQRSSAVEMLGDVGALQIRKFFLWLGRTERDAVVQTAILKALGQIGTDSDGQVQEYVASVISREQSGTAHDEVGRAALECIEALYRREGALRASTAATLIAISNAGYQTPIPGDALEFLKSVVRFVADDE